jgi:hypothetical protein
MHRNGKDFTVIKLMQPGVYQARQQRTQRGSARCAQPDPNPKR